MTTIYCVGETLAEFEAGNTKKVIDMRGLFNECNSLENLNTKLPKTLAKSLLILSTNNSSV